MCRELRMGIGEGQRDWQVYGAMDWYLRGKGGRDCQV